MFLAKNKTFQADSIFLLVFFIYIPVFAALIDLTLNTQILSFFRGMGLLFFGIFIFSYAHNIFSLLKRSNLLFIFLVFILCYSINMFVLRFFGRSGFDIKIFGYLIGVIIPSILFGYLSGFYAFKKTCFVLGSMSFFTSFLFLFGTYSWEGSLVGRLSFGFLNPNLIGGYACIGLAIVFLGFKMRVHEIGFAFLGFIINIYLVIESGSRSASISLGMICLIAILTLFGLCRNFALKIIIPTLFCGACFGVLAVPHLNHLGMEWVWTHDLTRVEIWRSVVGSLGMFYFDESNAVFVEFPHGILFDALIVGGVGLFGFLLSLILFVFWNCFIASSTRGFENWIVLASVLPLSLVSGHVWSAMLFWPIFGLILGRLEWEIESDFRAACTAKL